MANHYLERYAYPKQFINETPSQLVNIIVTIPCYNEPALLNSLESLYKCDLPDCHVEVIVVINSSESAPESIKKHNKATYDDARKWAKTNSNKQLQFHIILHADLPHKHAGVGLARKIAMDEAVRRFEQIDKKNGIISCFDADSQCDSNYLAEIENHFIKHPKSPGCSIYFEHPLQGEYDDEIYEAIIEYELFLRYYVNVLRFTGFPHAFETIGSSMAVRSAAYQKQGGMNRRKAGEDFYFLHRIIPLGDFTELNTTRIIPSPRISDRVPFGTGKAVGEWMNNKSLTTYNPLIFADLKEFIISVNELQSLRPDNVNDWLGRLPKSIDEFLEENNFEGQLAQIQNHSINLDGFRKRFFHWFNGFRVLKFVHFARDNQYGNISVLEAAQWLLTEQHQLKAKNAKQALLAIRLIDMNSAIGPSEQ